MQHGAEIFDSYQSMIYNLALRYCGDPSKAEDLAQEALLKVATKLHTFRGRSSLKTWIYRVAVNSFRSRLRRRRLETRSLDDAVTAKEPVDRATSPEQRADGAERNSQLARALATLPRSFREAVLLRDVEGLSYGEISQITRCRLGTVRSRIARGREALRKTLETGEPGE